MFLYLPCFGRKTHGLNFPEWYVNAQIVPYNGNVMVEICLFYTYGKYKYVGPIWGSRYLINQIVDNHR